MKPELKCVESGTDYGRFVAEPLEKGFGVTLGNTLRRVLMGSLLGAAVTEITVEGMQHEFRAIPHVKEDGIDFLLNVKALRLCSLTGREGKMSLDAKGERVVCAADIMASADFEVANPDLHLATLDSDEASLRVEFKVELGKGYVPAKHGDSLPIGVIPVDAIFTPIRKVNHQVEPTRIGQQGGYERLVLEVWTDGTISPREAFAKGVQIIVEQFSQFVLGDEGDIARTPVSPELHDLPIEQVGFTQSIVRCLRRNGLTSLGDVLAKTREELLSLDKFGPKSLEQVERILAERGLFLLEKAGKAVRASEPTSSADSTEELITDNAS